MLREAAHMHLVDNHVRKRNAWIMNRPPVEGVLHHPGMIGASQPLAARPDALDCHRPGIGVQQEFGSVENQTPGGVTGAVHPVGIFDILNIQIEHDHGIGAAHAALLREGQHREGLLVRLVKQTQLAGGAVKGMDGKADASRH